MNCVYRQWFFKVFLSPYSNLIYDFQPCPISGKISVDSLHLLMMLWIVDGEICKFCNCALKKIRLFAHTVFHSGKALSVLACEWLSLSRMQSYPIVILWSVTKYLFTCGMFQVFFEHFTTLSVFCCYSLNFCLTCWGHQFQNEYTFTKNIYIY